MIIVKNRNALWEWRFHRSPCLAEGIRWHNAIPMRTTTSLQHETSRYVEEEGGRDLLLRQSCSWHALCTRHDIAVVPPIRGQPVAMCVCLQDECLMLQSCDGRNASPLPPPYYVSIAPLLPGYRCWAGEGGGGTGASSVATSRAGFLRPWRHVHQIMQ